MKILFLTDDFYPNFGANSLIVRDVALEFVKMGHDVSVMPSSYKSSQKEIEIYNKIKIYRNFPIDDKKSFFNLLKERKLIGAIKLLRGMVISHRDSTSLKGKQKIAGEYFLRKWIKHNEIDLVITVCLSVENSFPVLRLKKRNQIACKWCFYMLDPFASHEYYKQIHSENYLKTLQHQIMSYANNIVLTKQIYAELKQWESVDILEKTRIVQFPKMSKPHFTAESCAYTFDKNIVNVVCTGSRNENVRNSIYTLNVCRAIADKLKNVKFHFIGLGWAEKQIIKENNMAFYPPCSWDEIRNLQLQADFLLNIGNKVTNQLPSKVIEYISTGKPIINFYKSEDCPTIELLEGYDALNVDENCEFDKERFIKFLSSRHEILAYEDIEKKYSEYTPNHVANIMLENTMSVKKSND